MEREEITMEKIIPRILNINSLNLKLFCVFLILNQQMINMYIQYIFYVKRVFKPIPTPVGIRIFEFSMNFI